MEKFKIVADSSADVLKLDKIPFSSAALKIITDQKEFTDNNDINLKEMVDYLASYKGKSSTSCPNSQDWLDAFGDGENIFCVTITSNLSGSYNAALLAKEIYEERHPERKVFVIDSLSAGPELKLIIDKLQDLILEGLEYPQICEKITEYTKTTGLLFMLESMKNLANNGRVSHLVAKAAGLLGIRMVGKASDVGTLEPLNKCRGQENALRCIVKNLKDLGYKSGKICIAHCFNLKAAQTIKALILKEFPHAKTEIYPCRALCSFYAEIGGLLLGFEKN